MCRFLWPVPWKRAILPLVFFCCLPYELTSDDVSIARMPSVPWSEPCAASTLFFLCLIPFVIVDRCLLDNSNVDGVAGVSE
jgi:hypothetical protein